MKFNKISNAIAWGADAPLEFKPFVGARGPTGRRAIIDEYVLECTFNVDVATAVIAGENVPKIFSNMRLNDAVGPRRNFSGAGLRQSGLKLLGAKVYQEESDVSIGSAETGTWRLQMPFTLGEHTKDGKAYGIPADLMKSLNLTCAGASALNLGSSAVTINSISIAVRAYCHEEEWNRVSFKSRDLIKEAQMQGTDETTFEVSDEEVYLDWAIGYKAADGDTDMSNWTSHLVRPFQLEVETAAKKVWDHIRDQKAVDYTDPISDATPTAVVIHSTGGEAKQQDHPLLTQFTVVATNSISGVTILQRSLQPRDEKVDNAVKKTYGVKATRAKRPIPGGKRSERFGERLGSA